MSRGIRIYLAGLLILIFGWLAYHFDALGVATSSFGIITLTVAAVFYTLGHVLRMARLTLLTLDERQASFDLVTAHALTAFPSSLIPFKLGEILRLSAFFHVYDGRQKALAVWVSERFGDVVVLTGLILCLYLFNFEVPSSVRALFFIFVIASSLGLAIFFAVTKVFVYLNRHLVLSSHTPRGLWILKASYALRAFEATIPRSIEGRLSALLLISMLIWGCEIAAVTVATRQIMTAYPDIAEIVTSGLLASIASSNEQVETAALVYQSVSVIALSLLFVILLTLTFHRIRRTK
ncbi:lysylphosphatidylglycerol synthase domain-containing protein [Achromobacter sp. PD1]|uniref:lysylphosphatidylglycerol synthase domain-containing protein n=1 Tax=Achromobacter sp. PD1 TaxID=3399125 RepID=UPI003AF515A9